MQTSGSRRWRFCSILFLPPAAVRVLKEAAAGEGGLQRLLGTTATQRPNQATPTGARSTDVAAFPVALPNGSGGSNYASPASTSNLPTTQKTLHGSQRGQPIPDTSTKSVPSTSAQSEGPETLNCCLMSEINRLFSIDASRE